MTFADRYSKILRDNNLDPADAIRETGVSKDVIYNLTSKKTSGKYELLTDLFKVCKDVKQVYELATGKHMPESNAQEQNCHSELLTIVKTLSADLIETKRMLSDIMDRLVSDVSDIRSEIHQMKEDHKSTQVTKPQKIPECHQR